MDDDGGRIPRNQTFRLGGRPTVVSVSRSATLCDCQIVHRTDRFHLGRPIASHPWKATYCTASPSALSSLRSPHPARRALTTIRQVHRFCPTRPKPHSYPCPTHPVGSPGASLCRNCFRSSSTLAARLTYFTIPPNSRATHRAACRDQCIPTHDHILLHLTVWTTAIEHRSQPHYFGSSLNLTVARLHRSADQGRDTSSRVIELNHRTTFSRNAASGLSPYCGAAPTTRNRSHISSIGSVRVPVTVPFSRSLGLLLLFRIQRRRLLRPGSRSQCALARSHRGTTVPSRRSPRCTPRPVCTFSRSHRHRNRPAAIRPAQRCSDTSSFAIFRNAPLHGCIASHLLVAYRCRPFRLFVSVPQSVTKTSVRGLNALLASHFHRQRSSTQDDAPAIAARLGGGTHRP